MKANELMIGDWVNRLGKNEQVDWCFMQCFASAFMAGFKEDKMATLEPIPLTEDILKANGYTKYSYEDESISFQIGYHYNVLRVSELKKNKDEDFFVTCMGLGRIEFHYVHELQHALRLCGLTELADNFKVV